MPFLRACVMKSLREVFMGGTIHFRAGIPSRNGRKHYNGGMKILVAMSGGVDSSVVAHLLKREGHELIGVRFTLWSDPLAPALAQILPSKCCTTQTAARTRQVADTLRIPLHIVDLEEEF